MILVKLCLYKLQLPRIKYSFTNENKGLNPLFAYVAIVYCPPVSEQPLIERQSSVFKAILGRLFFLDFFPEYVVGTFHFQVFVFVFEMHLQL